MAGLTVNRFHSCDSHAGVSQACAVWLCLVDEQVGKGVPRPFQSSYDSCLLAHLSQAFVAMGTSPLDGIAPSLSIQPPHTPYFDPQCCSYLNYTLILPQFLGFMVLLVFPQGLQFRLFSLHLPYPNGDPDAYSSALPV